MKKTIDEAKVLDMFDRGCSREEIKTACHIGCVQTVSEILKRNGRNYKDRDLKARIERDKKIVEMYMSGMTYKEIGDEVGLSLSYIFDILSAAEVVGIEGKPSVNIPLHMQQEWTRVVNMFRTQVFRTEPFKMPEIL